MSWNRLSIPALAVLFLTAGLAHAQQQQGPGLPLPRLDSAMPCGAKAGSTIELTLAGTDLEDAEAVIFSHPGLKAEPINPEPPKADPKDPKKADPKDPKKADPKDPKKADPKDPKKDPPPAPKSPQPARKFKVTVAGDVPVGQYDVRVINKWGVSNPRVFCVGDLTEVAEKEPNNDIPEATRIELNSTITGTIANPTDVDYCVFAGKKGQRVVVSCLASSIDSRLRPMVEIFDVSGRRLAANRNYKDNDAVADAILNDDGDYYVRLSEFTYTQGTPNHFYRLTVSTGPWIDSVYPPMVEPGKPSQVTLYGRNLPGGTMEPGALADGRPLEKLVVTITPPPDAVAQQRITYKGRIDPRTASVDGFEYRLKGPAGLSNPMLIALASAKVLVEKDSVNDKPESAEDIAAPCEVAGRIDKRLDRDWFALTLKKGETYSIDLWCDRLGAPSDLYFTVRKAGAMTDMVEEDDNPDIMNPQQFFNRTSDPRPYKLTATEDGRYLIGVGSRESNFSYGPRNTYRLRMVLEKPDFRVIVMASSNYQPDCTVLRADGSQYLDVFVYRNDGFAGAVTLSAEGLPAGVTCPPTVVSTGMKQGQLVLSAAANAAPWNGTITVKATATINGQPVVREARYASITWAVPPQQNLPTIARLDQSLHVCVREKAHFNVTLEPDKAFVKKEDKLPQPILVKQGDKLTVPFKVTRGVEPKTPITMQQMSMGIAPQQAPVTVNNGQPTPPIAPDKNDGNFIIDIKPNAPLGMYTVVMKATTPIQFVKDPNTKKQLPVTVVGASTPITFKVLPLSVAKITATPKGNFKGGVDGEITVKVERQFEYTGEFKVKLILPMGTKGITAADVTIPAGKDEVVIPVKVAGDVAAGNLQNVAVQATAMVEGTVPTLHEVKFNVTVEKAPPPKKEEPKKVDPKKEEPKKVEPKKVDPKKEEPKKK
jgi:hypothetical protein